MQSPYVVTTILSDQALEWGALGHKSLKPTSLKLRLLWFSPCPLSSGHFHFALMLLVPFDFKGLPYLQLLRSLCIRNPRRSLRLKPENHRSKYSNIKTHIHVFICVCMYTHSDTHAETHTKGTTLSSQCLHHCPHYYRAGINNDI